MNFLAKMRASWKPSATSIISQINAKSGTTIAHGRKRAFKFSAIEIEMRRLKNQCNLNKFLRSTTIAKKWVGGIIFSTYVIHFVPHNLDSMLWICRLLELMKSYRPWTWTLTCCSVYFKKKMKVFPLFSVYVLCNVGVLRRISLYLSIATYFFFFFIIFIFSRFSANCIIF